MANTASATQIKNLPLVQSRIGNRRAQEEKTFMQQSMDSFVQGAAAGVIGGVVGSVVHSLMTPRAPAPQAPPTDAPGWIRETLPASFDSSAGNALAYASASLHIPAGMVPGLNVDYGNPSDVMPGILGNHPGVPASEHVRGGNLPYIPSRVPGCPLPPASGADFPADWGGAQLADTSGALSSLVPKLVRVNGIPVADLPSGQFDGAPSASIAPGASDFKLEPFVPAPEEVIIASTGVVRQGLEGPYSPGTLRPPEAPWPTVPPPPAPPPRNGIFDNLQEDATTVAITATTEIVCQTAGAAVGAALGGPVGALAGKTIGGVVGLAVGFGLSKAWNAIF